MCDVDPLRHEWYKATLHQKQYHPLNEVFVSMRHGVARVCECGGNPVAKKRGYILTSPPSLGFNSTGKLDSEEDCPLCAPEEQSPGLQGIRREKKQILCEIGCFRQFWEQAVPSFKNCVEAKMWYISLYLSIAASKRILE